MCVAHLPQDRWVWNGPPRSFGINHLKSENRQSFWSKFLDLSLQLVIWIFFNLTMVIPYLDSPNQKIQVFSEFDQKIDWFYPKHLDTTLVFDFRTLIACLWLGETKAKKCLQRLNRLRKNPQNFAKKTAKTRKTLKSWNLVVLGSFQIFVSSKIPHVLCTGA